MRGRHGHVVFVCRRPSAAQARRTNTRSDQFGFDRSPTGPCVPRIPRL